MSGPGDARARRAGESLADRLAREGRIPPPEVARILRDVASALDVAHRRGVSYGGLRPHKIMLERDTGRVLLADPVTPHGDESTAADLHALGLLGYEMLTGKPPLDDAQPAEPVEKARAGIPPSLATVVNRCLDRDPEKRFKGAAEIVRALGGSVVTPVSGARISVMMGRGARRSRRPLWLGVGLVLALILGAGLLARRRPAARTAEPAQPRAPAPRGMVLIPAGTYTIGSNDGPPWSRPAHQVALPAFYIDKTEVTLGAYRQFAVGAGLWAPPRKSEGDSLLPVTGVQWTEATSFCGDHHFPRGRLPTEEEWEAAARGTGATRYPWGPEWVPGAANTASARLVGPAPVGAFPRGKSPLGVTDLIGNVWEWTSSPAKAYPGGSAPPGSGPGVYVIRGGAWNTPDSLADASYRGTQRVADPRRADRADLATIGFRCVAPVTPPN